MPGLDSPVLLLGRTWNLWWVLNGVFMSLRSPLSNLESPSSKLELILGWAKWRFMITKHMRIRCGSCNHAKTYKTWYFQSLSAIIHTLYSLHFDDRSNAIQRHCGICLVAYSVRRLHCTDITSWTWGPSLHPPFEPSGRNSSLSCTVEISAFIFQQLHIN